MAEEVGGYRHGRVPRELRFAQLQEVALRLFAERGYDGTSIEDIRRAAGVSRPLFYDHFASKEEAYVACLRQAREELDAAIDEGVDADDPAGLQLVRGAEGYFAFAEHHPLSWRLLFGDGTAATGQAADIGWELRLTTVARIAALVRRAVPAFDERQVDATAFALSGAGEMLCKWWQRNPQMTRQELVSHLVAFAWTGLEQQVRDGG